ncbi:hypothetical protein [Thiocapsa bogorovii]|uniref:hypothetical protein n=1 Tax=Thiocapsa bogorovii TaxID=521689 RepID=UPI001E4EE563|nr:hypothetical protein [Thiocapsa bogorovii]UHD16884.1 hypothetical protein LT988_02115 [Thiocapsa bogorovii]
MGTFSGLSYDSQQPRRASVGGKTLPFRQQSKFIDWDLLPMPSEAVINITYAQTQRYMLRVGFALEVMKAKQAINDFGILEQV